MANSKTEHSKALRGKTATEWNKTQEKLGNIKQFKGTIREKKAILALTKIANKSAWITKALQTLDENGDIKKND